MDFIVQQAQKAQQEINAPQVGQANIKVIGCGGAGNNMVDWLSNKGIQGAEIIAINTDQQHLNATKADKKFLIGKTLTRGLGCGGFPEKGAQAAKDDQHIIKEFIRDSDMTFICAGMGGGTGTGSAHVVAKIASEMGQIVIGTVTMPFKIERARIDRAEFGLEQLRASCDTVIVIDNNKLTEIAGNLPIQQAFSVANELISTMIRGIVETIAVPSLVNLDFADVKAIMKNGGVAAIGIGCSDTKNRVDEAVQGALQNPLLDISYEGAQGALLHIEGGPDLTLDEVARIGDLITAQMDQDANVIWGARINKDMAGKLTVMTIMTGVHSPYITGASAAKQQAKREASRSFNDELGISLA
ncbi:cell division protein FtsZ [Candidatus Woesearchaeota archaeon]|nr:cell division protein FtsZ [Candidatus Woesearchaeota archaeon]